MIKYSTSHCENGISETALEIKENALKLFTSNLFLLERKLKYGSSVSFASLFVSVSGIYEGQSSTSDCPSILCKVASHWFPLRAMTSS